MTTTAPFLQKPPARREEGRREAGNANGAELCREPWSRAEKWILVAVCALALFVRMFRLSAFAIWVDEAHTWRDVTMPLSEFFDSARAWYPTSSLMLRAWLDSGALPKQITEAGESMTLVLQALADFHYDTLTVDLDGAAAGDGTVLLKLRNCPAAAAQLHQS